MVTVHIDHPKIRQIAIENGLLFVSEFAPASLLDSATFSDQVLAIQQAGQNYPNAMQEVTYVMATEGCVTCGIGWSAANTKVKCVQYFTRLFGVSFDRWFLPSKPTW